MPEPFLDRERVCALRDREGGGGVSELVEHEASRSAEVHAFAHTRRKLDLRSAAPFGLGNAGPDERTAADAKCSARIRDRVHAVR